MFTPLPAILLVDDDPTSNYLSERLIRRLGAAQEVLVAQNGQRALDLLRERCGKGCVGCPSLVLLDVNMPVMNGFEFLESLLPLTIDCNQEIVVVILTTSQLDEDILRTHYLPVTDFLTKPLTYEKLTNVLARFFNRPISDN